jgi:Tfp pilus assembly PilM family ATPase
MANFLGKLVSPRYPSAAVSIERGKIVVVQLDKSRQGYTIRRMAAITIPEKLVNPSFDTESNISDLQEFAAALSDVALSAGLGKQRKWSIALPEGSTRSIIITLENDPASKTELAEILRWKTERGFGASEEDIQVARERLAPDASGRARFFATAVRKSVLAEFETVFDSLGWRAGLTLPRNVAESQWISGAHLPGDSLLVTSHDGGFTVAVFRQSQPLAVRSITCDGEDRHDELYRFLLFYRDRLALHGVDTEANSIQRLLLAGPGFAESAIGDAAAETLESDIHQLQPRDLGLIVPTDQISFGDLAAATGLAQMAW